MPLLFAVLLLLLPVASHARDVIIPKALEPGDTIALVAPARAIPESRVTELVEGLEALGYRVKAAPNLTTRFGYLAGTDEERASTIMEAFADPEVDAIFCVIGGYGTTRLLNLLDYDVIRENPKIVTGFSDITGLHLGIHAKTGLVTFHSPTTTHAYTKNEEARPFQVQHLWRAIAVESYSPGIDGYTIPMDEPSSPVLTLVGGKGRGHLTGGNLSLLHALMGTPYEPDTKGAILFLEDVNEAPYRVDRMLSTLELAGKLDELAGVVLGRFTQRSDEDWSGGFSHAEVFDQYFSHRDYPVVNNFPVGHVLENATMPIGIQVELDADAGTLRVLENPVRLP